MKRGLTLSVLVATVLVLNGCGGNGGADISGLWTDDVLPVVGGPQTKVFAPPGMWFFEQAGSVILGRNEIGEFAGYMDGDELFLRQSFEAVTIEWQLDVNNSGSLTGTGTVNIDGDVVDEISVDIRKLATPTGRLTIVGSADGEDLTLESEIAYGVDWNDGDYDRVVVHQGHDRYFDLYVVADEDLRPGTYQLSAATEPPPGTMGLEIVIEDGPLLGDFYAATGTVTITKVDDEGFAGSFSVTAWDEATGTLSGSFNVPKGFTIDAGSL